MVRTTGSAGLGAQFHHNHHNHQQHQLQQQRRSASSTALAASGWWEDDLPNLFGINPIEASILLGALYYFYGSEVLYDFAREAGRLFSTYAPVVKDVSFDIFNEFRDYLEEDRERAALRKSGVDVDSLPRRTTNIIEKFQETLGSISGSEAGKAEAQELQSAYGGGGGGGMGAAAAAVGRAAEVSGAAATTTTAAAAGAGAGGEAVDDAVSALTPSGARRSKREVLQARNVDVERVMQATDAVSRADELAVAGLSESISAVRDSLDAIKASAAGAGAAGGVGGSEAGGVEGLVGAEQQLQPQPQPQQQASGGALGMSKFQQQMSGEWNNRVLRRDKWGASSSGGMGNFDFPNTFGAPDEEGMRSFDGADSDRGDGFGGGGGEGGGDDDDDLTSSFVQRWERSSTGEWQRGDDVPQEIESASPALAVTEGPSPLSTPALEPLLASGPALQALQALDQDYLALRQRFVALLAAQQQGQGQGVAAAAATGPGPGSEAAPAPRTKYWPPLARHKRGE